MNLATFYQGEIWLVRLDPTEGSELKKTRPCLILSRTKVNQKLETLTIIPLTSGKKERAILRIGLAATRDNGLKKDSHLEIPQIRTVAKSRCLKKLGRVDWRVLYQIRDSFDIYFWNELI